MNPLRKLILLGVVALLPLPVFAQGTVVYVNPPDVRVGGNETPIYFDLNGDGVDDVQFDRNGAQFDVIPTGNNQVSAIANQAPEAGARATPIPAGVQINASTSWQGRFIDPLLGEYGSLLALDYTFPATGPFAGVDGYLGIRFNIGEALHYGWIRLKMDSAFPYQARGYVTEWAYNSAPGEFLAAGVVPEPSTLALVALGAGGLLFLQRRR